MSGSYTKKICLLVVALNLIALGFYLFLFFEIKSINQRTGAVAATLSAAKKKNETLGLLKDTVAKTAPERQELDSAFVQSDGVVNFLDWIEGLANQELSVTVNSVAIEAAQPARDTLEAVHLSVQTKGTWQGVFRFLELLEVSPYEIVINHATLVKTQNDGTAKNGKEPKTPAANWEGDFDINILKLKQAT